MKIVFQESADPKRLAIERERLQIDQTRFEAEDKKHKRKPRLAEYLRENFLAFVAALVSVATLALSASQVWVAQINKEKDLALLKAQQDREWRYKALEFVTDKSDVFFGSDPTKAKRMAGALAVGFPRDVADEILGKLQISVQENVVGGITDVRAEVRSSHPAFRVPNSPRRITDIIVHTTESSDAVALHIFSGLDNPRGISIHYLILRDGKVLNLVDEANIAFHAHSYNETSIGIEISHLVMEGPLPDVQRQALISLLAGIAKRHAIPIAHVVGHREINPGTTACPEGIDMAAIRNELQHLQ